MLKLLRLSLPKNLFDLPLKILAKSSFQKIIFPYFQQFLIVFLFETCSVFSPNVMLSEFSTTFKFGEVLVRW